MVLDEDTSKAETNFKIQPEIPVHLETSSSVLGLEFCVLQYVHVSLAEIVSESRKEVIIVMTPCRDYREKPHFPRQSHSFSGEKRSLTH